MEYLMMTMSLLILFHMNNLKN